MTNDPFADEFDLDAALDEERSDASAWMPAVGDKLVGQVVGMAEHDAGHGPYPIVIVAADADGEDWAFHAFHSVAKAEIESQRPVPGDRIGIKYEGPKRGKNGNNYESYRVLVRRAV